MLQWLQVRCALVLACVVALATHQAEAQTARPAELVAALKQGGLVAYIRHAATESGRDGADADPDRCASQRALSEAGWREARVIGAGFGTNRIPVADVVTGRFCRTWQTASLAFNRYRKTAVLDVRDGGTVDPAAIRAKLIPLVAKPPEPGRNRVIVADAAPLEAITGIRSERTGVLYVLRPLGDRVEVLGAIPPEFWLR